MAVKIFKNHARDCEVHRLYPNPGKHAPVKVRTAWARNLRAFEKCDCMYWASGKDKVSGSIIARGSCRTSDKSKANAFVASVLAQLRGTTVQAVVASGGTGLEAPGLTVAEGVRWFLRDIRGTVKPITLESYELCLHRFVKFCEKNRVMRLSDLSVGLVKSFRLDGLPKMADSSRAVNVTRLKTFLLALYQNEKIDQNLSDRIKRPRFARQQKEAFTDEQIPLIFKEAEAVSENFSLLVRLMLTTGMRVGDALSYAPANCQLGTKLWTYSFVPQKRRLIGDRTPVQSYFDNRLKGRIDQLREEGWLSPTKPFWMTSDDASYERVRAAFLDIGEKLKAKLDGVTCTPYITRHTFARLKLEGKWFDWAGNVRTVGPGISIDDLSRLLHHSSPQITAQSYNRWAKSKAVRLENITADSIGIGPDTQL